MTDNSFLTRTWVVVILALTSSFLWGSAFPAIKIGYELFNVSMDDTASKILFAGYRFFLAGIVLLALCVISGKKAFSLHALDYARLGVMGVISTTMQYAFFYVGLSNTTGVKGAIMGGTTTFFSVLFAHFAFSSERITRQVALGCLIGFAGVISVNFSPGAMDFSFSLTGEGFLLITAVFGGIGFVYGKIISQQMDSVLMTAWQLVFGGAILVIAGFAFGGTVYGFTLKSSLLLFYMSCISSAGFAIMATLMKYNPVSRVSIFQFTIPLFGAGLSALFLHESLLEWKNLAALIFISFGIYLTTQAKRPAAG